MTYDFEEFGKRVSAERKALGLSQSEFLKKLHEHGVDMGRTSLSLIESGKANGNTTLDVLNGLCSVFGCEMGYLLGEPGYVDKTRHTTKITQETGLTSDSVKTLKKYQNIDVTDIYQSFKNNVEADDTLIIPVVNCLLESPAFEVFLNDLKCFADCTPGSMDYSEMIGTMYLDLGFLAEAVRDNYARLLEEYKPFVAEVIAKENAQLEKQIQKIEDRQALLQDTINQCASKLAERGLDPDDAELCAKRKAIHDLEKEKRIEFNTSALIKMVNELINEEQTQKREIPHDFKKLPTDKKLNIIFKSQNSSAIKDFPKSIKKSK